MTSSKPLVAVSLFAGIEGFGLAFERAGVEVVAAVEIDTAARGVIHDRRPRTTLFNDVCEVTPDDLRAAGFDPERGILAGGWPCQDLSVAGRRLGLGGARSGLVWEVVRLLAGLRPRWFVLENVPGLLSAVCPCTGGGACGAHCTDPHSVRGGACGPGQCMDQHGGAMGAILGALADLGYGVAYRVLDAQHFGVPQRRRRIVFIGCLGDWAAPVQVLLEPEGGRRNPAPGGAARSRTAVVSALRAGSGGGCGPDDNDARGGRLIAGPLQAAGSNGRGHRVDAEGAATGHLVPTVSAKWAKNSGGPAGDEAQNLVPVAFDAAQITHRESRVNPQPGDPSMPLIATGSPHVAFALRSTHAGVGQGHNTTYVTAHALTAEGHDASEDGTGRGTPLVPVVFDWQTDGSERARPNLSTERTSSIATTKRDAVADAAAVRRLTPVECERLQGFPDGWTATSDGLPQSDAARYRQLGNAVAVPVFEWVARRLVAVDAGGAP